MLSEDELIDKYFTPLSGEGAFNLKDDAALIGLKIGQELVVTTDTIIENIHFFSHTDARDVAAKALRVNLSDLAAKGAVPHCYQLAVSLPANITLSWLQSFVSQLRAEQELYGITLLGGDTTRTSGPLVITLTAFGIVPKGKMVSRSGARLGDIVAVSGTIGDAALGLMFFKQPDLADRFPNEVIEQLCWRYKIPQPRVELVPLLQNYAHAAMDISDGFIGDFTKLCAASNISAEINLDAIPYSQAAEAAMSKHPAWRETALTGGDDYEIVFTLAEKNWQIFLEESRRLNQDVKVIGEIKSDTEGVRFLLNGKPQFFDQKSYRHF